MLKAENVEDGSTCRITVVETDVHMVCNHSLDAPDSQTRSPDDVIDSSDDVLVLLNFGHFECRDRAEY